MELLRKGLTGAVLAAALTVSAHAQDAPKQGGEIVVGHQASVKMLDPYFSLEHGARFIYNHVYEALLSRDESNAPATDLARSYEASPDNMTFSFKLRPGITFHDGKPLTSEDVKASLERAARVHVDKAIFTGLESIQTPDELSVVVTFSEPKPSFIDSLSSPRAAFSIIPAYDSDKEAAELSWIGTGPYKLEAFQPDSHATLVRNENYTPNDAYDGTDGLVGKKVPYLDKITFRWVAEDAARVAGLEAGELDVIEVLNAPAAERLAQDQKFQIFEQSDWEIFSLYVNHTLAPTDNLKFRQALQIGLAMEPIMAIATNDKYALSHGWQYPSQDYFAADAGDEIYNVADLEKAKALLQESGYDGEEIILMTRDDPDALNAAVVATSQFRDLGVNVKLEVYDFATAFAKLKDHATWNLWFDKMGTATWVGPYFVLQRFAGENARQGVNDPELVQLLKELTGKPTDAERKVAFAAFQQKMADDVVAIKIGDASRLQAARAAVKGYVPFRVMRMWNVWLDAED